jgi:hypothetical protein
VAGELVLSIATLVYFVVWLFTWVLMVFAPGRYLARVVFPLGRTMAGGALASAVWLRGDAPRLALPPYPRGATASATLWRIVRSRVTWRAYGWLGLCFLTFPVHLLGAGLFPLAPLWSRPWAALTVTMLGHEGTREAATHHPRSDPAKDGDHNAPSPPRGESQQFGESRTIRSGRGYGLIGMRERVAAVGGSLSVGPTPGGGFAVRAVLPAPWEGDFASRPTPAEPDILASQDTTAELSPTLPHPTLPPSTGSPASNGIAPTPLHSTEEPRDG